MNIYQLGLIYIHQFSLFKEQWKGTHKYMRV
jgi:hypothetical protein